MTPVNLTKPYRGLVCVFAFCVLWPSGVAAETGWGAIATPLRIVNLNPFHLLYGVPGSFGSRVLTPGSSELIASMDMASYLSAANAGTERVLIDGETYRQGLALRHGFRDRWEYLFEVTAVAHRGGVFDAFIENWHDTFGLIQSPQFRNETNDLAVLRSDRCATRRTR